MVASLTSLNEKVHALYMHNSDTLTEPAPGFARENSMNCYLCLSLSSFTTYFTLSMHLDLITYFVVVRQLMGRKGHSFQNFWLIQSFLTEPAQWGLAPKVRPCLELPTSE